jgi:hypothetical protein
VTPGKLTSSVRLVTLWATSTSMNRVTAHRVWSIDAMQLKVQAARVAHHFPTQVTTPNGRRSRAAVGAGQIFLRALLVVVGALGAVVVVYLRDVIRAGPQVITGRVAKITGSGCKWRRATHNLLAACVCKPRAAWTGLFSPSTALLLSILWERDESGS